MGSIFVSQFLVIDSSMFRIVLATSVQAASSAGWNFVFGLDSPIESRCWAAVLLEV